MSYYQAESLIEVQADTAASLARMLLADLPRRYDSSYRQGIERYQKWMNSIPRKTWWERLFARVFFSIEARDYTYEEAEADNKKRNASTTVVSTADYFYGPEGTHAGFAKRIIRMAATGSPFYLTFQDFDILRGER